MAVRILIAILIVAGAGTYARVLGAHRVAAGHPPRLELLPARFADWESQDFSLSPASARVLGADATLQRIYRNRRNQQVELFVAYFAQQAVNSQIHSPRHCLPGSGWKIVSTGDTHLDLPGGRQPATRMIIERQGVVQEMFYWFRTQSGSVTGEYALKLDLVRNSLARRPTDAAFVRYVVAVPDTTVLPQLMATLEPELHTLLRQSGLP